jgi:hypothetical protein
MARDFFFSQNLFRYVDPALCCIAPARDHGLALCRIASMPYDLKGQSIEKSCIDDFPDITPIK